MIWNTLVGARLVPNHTHHPLLPVLLRAQYPDFRVYIEAVARLRLKHMQETRASSDAAMPGGSMATGGAPAGAARPLHARRRDETAVPTLGELFEVRACAIYAIWATAH